MTSPHHHRRRDAHPASRSRSGEEGVAGRDAGKPSEGFEGGVAVKGAEALEAWRLHALPTIAEARARRCYS